MSDISKVKVHPLIDPFNIKDSNAVHWSERKGYVGKNLIPTKYSRLVTINGITYTVNSDWSITANGTSTDYAYFVFVQHTFTADVLKLMAGKDVILSGGIDDNKYISFRYKETSSSSFVSFKSIGYPVKFTVPDDIDTYYRIEMFIEIRPGVTVSDLTFYPMLRLASIADDTYEPYLPNNKELKSNIGDLSDLNTTAKNNLVEAINEAAQGGSGGSSTFADLTDTNISNPAQGQVPKYNTTSQKWENGDVGDMRGEHYAYNAVSGAIDNSMAVQLLYGNFDDLTYVGKEYFNAWDDNTVSYTFTFAGGSYAAGDTLVCFVDTAVQPKAKRVIFDSYNYSYTDTSGNTSEGSSVSEGSYFITETVPSDCDPAYPFSITVSVTGPLINVYMMRFKGTNISINYPTNRSNTTRFFVKSDGTLGYYDAINNEFKTVGGGGNPILPINPSDQTYKSTPGAIWIET